MKGVSDLFHVKKNDWKEFIFKFQFQLAAYQTIILEPLGHLKLGVQEKFDFWKNLDS